MAKRISEKEEKFCVEVVTGVDEKGGSITITEAHRRAYPSDKMSEKTRMESASRVMNRPHIQERIAELRAQLADKAQMNALDIVKELEQARKIALETCQPSAAVAATMGKAKVLGLLAPVKSEISGPGGAPIQVQEVSDEELKQKLTELGFGRYNNQLGSKVV